MPAEPTRHQNTIDNCPEYEIRIMGLWRSNAAHANKGAIPKHKTGILRSMSMPGVMERWGQDNKRKKQSFHD